MANIYILNQQTNPKGEKKIWIFFAKHEPNQLNYNNLSKRKKFFFLWKKKLFIYLFSLSYNLTGVNLWFSYLVNFAYLIILVKYKTRISMPI